MPTIKILINPVKILVKGAESIPIILEIASKIG